MAKSLSEFEKTASDEQKQLLLAIVQQIEEGERFMEVVRELEELGTDGIRVTESDKRTIGNVIRKLANLLGQRYRDEQSAQSKTGKIDWLSLVEKMKKQGATSKDNAMGRSEVELLYFGNDQVKFEHNQWNAEKHRHLKQIGERRGALYFVKAD